MSTAMVSRSMRLRCNICRRYLKPTNVKIMFCDRCEGSVEICSFDWGRHKNWSMMVLAANEEMNGNRMWELFKHNMCRACIEEVLS